MNSLAKTLAAISLAIAAGASAADADILAFGSYAGTTYLTPTSEQALPLKPTGATAITFKTVKPDTVVTVTYNAECRIDAVRTGGGLAQMYLTIRIDDLATHPYPPTHRYVLCGEDVPGVSVGAYSRQVALRVRQAGTHTVRVYGLVGDGVVGSTISGSLANPSILIQN
jgi:hypothetical protein